MVIKKSVLVISSVAIIAAVVFFIIFKEKPVDVSVFKVRRGDVKSTVTSTSTGTLKARAISKISSQQQGRIERILKREGSRIKKGETLLVIENSETLAQIGQAKANLRAAEASYQQIFVSRDVVVSQSAAMLTQAEARLTNAKKGYERATSLFSKGMVSKKELDDATAEFNVAEAEYDTAMANILQGKIKEEEINTARARVEQMRSNLDLIKVQLAWTYIRSPYSGIITDLYVEEGELLNIGTPVLEIADDSELEIEAPIDEVDVGEVKVGQDVKLTFDAFRERVFSGKIKEISPLVSTTKEQNRTVDIKIRPDSLHEEIRVGMSTDVEIITGKAEGVLYIPTNIIIERAEGQFVYVAKDGRSLEKRIRTGLSNWETAEVEEGLSEGDEVITTLGAQKLADDMKIRVIKKE